ncbi:MAG: hypothetical protein ACN4GW_14870, partial [Desulforhopalus sp.]
ELIKLLALLESENLNDQQLISHTIGIIFDSKSAWSTLRIGELKALIFLAIGDKKASLEWCNWVHHYGHLHQDRRRLFRLLETLLNFHNTGEAPTNYSKSLHFFYREEEIRLAEDIVATRSTFPGLNFGSCWTEISRDHKKLLSIYQHLNRFK